MYDCLVVFVPFDMICFRCIRTTEQMDRLLMRGQSFSPTEVILIYNNAYILHCTQ